MNRSLRLRPVSVLSAIALAACGSTNHGPTVASLGGGTHTRHSASSRSVARGHGDLADATVVGTAPNCYRGNTDRSGRLTVAPHGLQTAHGCATARDDTPFGLLSVEVVCAVRALGDCHGGNGNGVLSRLATLSHLLHTPFDASAARNTKAIYPSPGHYVAPRPAAQQSLRP